MRRGDFIRWKYKYYDSMPMRQSEQLWSSIHDSWVPIGSSMSHLLVDFDDVVLKFLNEEGAYTIRRDDHEAAFGTVIIDM